MISEYHASPNSFSAERTNSLKGHSLQRELGRQDQALWVITEAQALSLKESFGEKLAELQTPSFICPPAIGGVMLDI